MTLVNLCKIDGEKRWLQLLISVCCSFVFLPLRPIVSHSFRNTVLVYQFPPWAIMGCLYSNFWKLDFHFSKTSPQCKVLFFLRSNHFIEPESIYYSFTYLTHVQSYILGSIQCNFNQFSCLPGAIFFLNLHRILYACILCYLDSRTYI